jgi:hypothetical protein
MRAGSSILRAGIVVLASLSTAPAAWAAAAPSASQEIPRTSTGRPDLSGNYDLTHSATSCAARLMEKEAPAKRAAAQGGR